jgi:ABC-type nickel/cobalt efflux system permease component RcnA
VTALGVVLTLRGLDSFPSGVPRWLPATLTFAAAMALGLTARDLLWRPSPHPHHHHDHDHDHDHHRDHGHDHSHDHGHDHHHLTPA